MTKTTKKPTKRTLSPKAASKGPTTKALRAHKPRPAAPMPGAKGRRRNLAAPPKRPTKASLILAMATRPKGASMEELVAAFKNQEHTLRAVISVESRKAGVKAKTVEGPYRVVKD